MCATSRHACRTARSSSTAFALMLGVACAAGPAAADPHLGPVVYLNEVKLEGTETRGLSLTNVDVRFDDHGDVHIVARGYHVSVLPVASTPAAAAPAAPSAPGSPSARTPPPPPAPSPSPAPPPSTGKRIFIVPSPQEHPGYAQWDIDLLINGEPVHRFRSRDTEPMFEVTRMLKPGENRLHFTARKEPGERLSSSSADVFELQIEEGETQKGKLELTPLSRYRRTAAEIGAFETEVVVETGR